MRILDRYIIKSILGIFLGCLTTFFFLFIIIDLFGHLDTILSQQMSGNILKSYYLSYLPIIFTIVTPICCLLATLYTFAKLNRDNEIIAMRSSGMNIYNITRTAVVLGLILSITVFWVNDRFVPQAQRTTKTIKEAMDKEAAAKKDRTKKKGPEYLDNLAVYGARNRLVFINRFYPDKNFMQGILILEHDQKQNITKKIIAASGIYQDNMWRFFKSTTMSFDRSGQIEGEPRYMEEEIIPMMETPYDLLHQVQHPDYMNIQQLKGYIKRLSKSGANTVLRRLKVNLYQRYTEPFTALMIVLLAIPFALRMQMRATGLSSFGIALLLGFLYYVVDALSIASGMAGILPAFLAASLAHILAITISLYLIRGLA